jgi:hypothetical protein
MFMGWSSIKSRFFLFIKSTQKKQGGQMCQKRGCLFLIFFSETTGPIMHKILIVKMNKIIFLKI